MVTVSRLACPCGLLVQAGVRSQFAPPVLRRARRSIASSFRGSADDSRAEPDAHPERPHGTVRPYAVWALCPYARRWSRLSQAKQDLLASLSMRELGYVDLDAESAFVEREPSSSMTVRVRPAPPRAKAGR